MRRLMLVMVSTVMGFAMNTATPTAIRKTPATTRVQRSALNAIAPTPRGGPLFSVPTQCLEIAISGHKSSQHSADFSVEDDIRPAVHVGRLEVNDGKRGTVRLCDHR